MDYALEGRVAVVTGGGSGIGRATARALSRMGADVVIAGRSDSRLRSASRSLGVDWFRCDVTTPGDVRELFDRVIDSHGGVDLLVTSAGAFDGSPVEDLTDATWRHVLDVNVTGTFLCAREAFRVMRPRGRGRIVIVGSIAAHRSRHNSVAYATSKHAIAGLTESLALEGRDDGIVVSCIHPGNTAVERRRNGGIATGLDDGPEPMMSADVVAQLIVAMATVPDDVNVLETVVLPARQRYLGRG